MDLRDTVDAQGDATAHVMIFVIGGAGWAVVLAKDVTTTLPAVMFNAGD